MREKASEIITKCLKKKNLSQSKLATMMGEDVRGLNQQLHRQKDIKVTRFSDVLEHVGYRLEIVDNDGIQRVCHDFAKQIIETKTPMGYFYTFDGCIYIGINNGIGEAQTKEFSCYDDCIKWLKDISINDYSNQIHQDSLAKNL